MAERTNEPSSEPANEPTGGPIIEADGIGIRFPKNRQQRPRLREMLRYGSRRQRVGSFWTLRGVSFAIQPGESVGVIGANGSGKSTLLKLMTGVLYPDEGSLTLRANASLLELRSGLARELSGRDNIFLLGALHGMDRHMLEERFDDIVGFAGLEDDIDTPVRRYSAGMQTRLGFAVAVQLDAPILLVDEVLAVGDRKFKRKCYAAIEKMLANGRTLVLVSHNDKDLRRFCQRGLYIRRGGLAVDSTLEEALAAYHQPAGRRARGGGGEPSPGNGGESIDLGGDRNGRGGGGAGEAGPGQR